MGSRPSELEDPALLGVGVLDNTFGEPQSDLLLGALDGIRAVADVAANSQSVITTDGADGGLQWVGSSKHDATGLHCVQALPDHSNYGSGGHVLNETGEEGLALKIGIVLLKVLWGCVNELEGDQLEATLFESTDDLADKRALRRRSLCGSPKVLSSTPTPKRAGSSSSNSQNPFQTSQTTCCNLDSGSNTLIVLDCLL